MTSNKAGGIPYSLLLYLQRLFHVRNGNLGLVFVQYILFNAVGEYINISRRKFPGADLLFKQEVKFSKAAA